MLTLAFIALMKAMEGDMSAIEEVAGISISERDRKDILDIYSMIRAAEAKLVGPDGKIQLLPANLYSFLCQILGI
jgi:hypothetical protein